MNNFKIKIVGENIFGWELWEGERMLCEGCEKSACANFTEVLARGVISSIVLSGGKIDVEMPVGKLPKNVIRLNDHR